ncbi:MAG: rhodanese-like domain-containing protein [Paracoccaceae bacterium]|jgi:rhodanese-related sulfurtransferase
MQKIFKLLQVLTVMIFTGTVVNAEIIKMTPDVAREMALAGELVLIDIRRPEEWAETGVPDVALLLDMTNREFLTRLNIIRLQNSDIPLAFTCRTGSRSDYLTTELEKLGFSGLIDVVGGMSGSRVDKGWAKRKLPIRSVNEPVNPMIMVTQP